MPAGRANERTNLQQWRTVVEALFLMGGGQQHASSEQALPQTDWRTAHVSNVPLNAVQKLSRSTETHVHLRYRLDYCNTLLAETADEQMNGNGQCQWKVKNV